jgi:hypothetical protein
MNCVLRKSHIWFPQTQGSLISAISIDPLARFQQRSATAGHTIVQINLNKFAFFRLLVPIYSLLNVCRFARSTSSLGWYTKLADSS